MTVWLCYQTTTGKAATQIHGGDVCAAWQRLGLLFPQGLPTIGALYCETSTY